MGFKKLKLDIEKFFDNTNKDELVGVLLNANKEFAKKLKKKRQPLSDKARSIKTYLKDKPFGCNNPQVIKLCSILLDENLTNKVIFDVPMITFITKDFDGLKDNYHFIMTEVFKDTGKIKVFGKSSGDIYNKKPVVCEDDFVLCDREEIKQLVDRFIETQGINKLKKLMLCM